MQDISIFGVRLSYRDLPAKTQQASGETRPTLLMVHGWCANHSVYEGQIESLNDNFRCVLVDLPGHGHSSKPFLEYSIVLLAEVLVGFCRRLELDKPVMIGHSMGGCVVIEAVAQHPDIASRLILLDPARIVPNAKVTRSFKRTLRGIEEIGFRPQFTAMMENGMFSGPNEAAMIEAAVRVMQKVPEHVGITCWRAMLEWAGASALRKCAHIPIAYLASHKPSNTYASMTSNHPKLTWAMPLCGTHHAHMTSPLEINAMIETFASDIL